MFFIFICCKMFGEMAVSNSLCHTLWNGIRAWKRRMIFQCEEKATGHDRGQWSWDTSLFFWTLLAGPFINDFGLAPCWGFPRGGNIFFFLFKISFTAFLPLCLSLFQFFVFPHNINDVLMIIQSKSCYTYCPNSPRLPHRNSSLASITSHILQSVQIEAFGWNWDIAGFGSFGRNIKNIYIIRNFQFRTYF